LEAFLNINDQISGIPLFEGLYIDQKQDLALISRQMKYTRGQRIFSEGDEGNGLYVVLNGQVKIFKMSPAGKEQILHIFGPGNPFGEIAMFAGQSFPANAEAFSDCRVLFFPRDGFIECIRNDPSLAFNMLAVMSRRLRKFATLIEDLSLKEVPGRLAAYLLFLSREKGEPEEVNLDVSKGQLASLLGTIPETLSRILAKMGKQGLIEVNGSNIILRDPNGLEDLAEGEVKLT
jgi:CRP/FNR family transcriptional regulator, dissimilatory nitrate respiration regulator